MTYVGKVGELVLPRTSCLSLCTDQEKFGVPDTKELVSSSSLPEDEEESILRNSKVKK
jgi:hypothetical protein